MRLSRALVLAAFALCASAAFAQTIKIGFITSYSGLNGNLGPYMERAVRLYIKLHENELPPGVKIELLTRDDTGPNPDKARQLAQELVVRDKVNLLAGVIFTPNAMAIAPIATEAKVPFVIMNAGTSVITTRSPYIARTSFTLWQSSYPLGQWAAKKFKTAYTLVSDFGPGHDSEEAFTKGFTEGGGKILGSVRVPLQNPDWAAYMQRVKDARPDALKVFIPANKAFVAAWKKEYGASEVPNFLSAASWDGTAMIFEAIKAQKGKLDPDQTMEIFKRYKNADSPRGPISIDPETRDIVQNEYLREVRKVGGQPANVELETVATALKDPWKELQKKK